jgi:hypothetical protein
VSLWNDRRAFLRKKAISALYPYSAWLPFGSYEQPELWVSRELRLCYVVNPKVASSSILVALTEAATGASVGPYWHNHPIVSRFRCTDFRLVPAECFRFSFVRHPWSRLASLYNEKFLRVRQEGGRFEYESYLGGVFNLADSLKEFCAKVGQIGDRIADRHFVSQSYWFDRICGVPLEHVGHMENLAEEWAAIARRIGRPAVLQRIKATGGDPASSQMPDVVRARYEADFRRFAYR